MRKKRGKITPGRVTEREFRNQMLDSMELERERGLRLTPGRTFRCLGDPNTNSFAPRSAENSAKAPRYSVVLRRISASGLVRWKPLVRARSQCSPTIFSPAFSACCRICPRRLGGTSVT